MIVRLTKPDCKMKNTIFKNTKMKKIFISIVVLIFAFFNSKAQLENPVVWTYTAKKINSKQYELHMTANIQPNWHIYSQDAGEGPEPTSFSFSKNPLVKFDGKIAEIGKLEKAFDPNFNSTLKFYNNKVDFVQKVSLKSIASTVIKGTLTFMVCNDRKCLPPKDVPFSIKIQGK